MMRQELPSAEGGVARIKLDTWNYNWKDGKSFTARLWDLTEITPPVRGQRIRASPRSINTVSAIRAIRHEGYGAQILPIYHKYLTKETTLRVREFGPEFGKLTHNKALYEAMVFAKERSGAFRKQPPVKVNQFVNTRWAQQTLPLDKTLLLQ